MLAHTPHNPAGTRGLAFIEFAAVAPAAVAELFATLGFTQVARSDDGTVSHWRQGPVVFVLNGAPGTHGGRFAVEHGPCISALAFRVADAAAAFDHAVAMGAQPYDGPARTFFADRALVGVGGSLLYLVDESSACAALWNRAQGQSGGSAFNIGGIDHLTHNVRAGQLQHWADFYSRIFGFREVFHMRTQGAATGFRTCALRSPCGEICIPLNEPTDPKSQIQEYIDVYHGEGVQHIALASTDLPATIERLDGRIDFMSIPDTYYAGVDARLPGHGENLPRLQRNGILLDGSRAADGRWLLLLQIFSRNLLGPIFFEFIQRKGNEGFGEGNAQALFEAIEREQIARGVVNA